MLLAQITDCHLVDPGELFAGRVDTAAKLRAAVAHIMAMNPRPDVVLATCDLVNDGTPHQYGLLEEILAPPPMAVYPVPGNHEYMDPDAAGYF